MTSGYVASHMTDASETSLSENVTHAPEGASGDHDSQPTSTGPDFYIRTDFHITVESNIRELAARYGLPEDLIAAVVEAESDFNPGAVSCRGAQGMMQLMPATAASLGVGNPFDTRQNLEAGVRHLRAMMDVFKNNVPLALAAYNAGELAVIQHRGIPPYRETRQYVNRILRRLDRDGVTASPLVNAAPRRLRAEDGALGSVHHCA
jgi:hypothetical protein